MKTMRHEMESRLIAKAWRDAAFKEQLLANPKPIIENEMGRRIGDATRVMAIEERPDTLYLVLPMRPETKKELSNAELEALASGEGPMPFGSEEH
jgi:hypothetical protein